jgi:hypothetical protein
MTDPQNAETGNSAYLQEKFRGWIFVFAGATFVVGTTSLFAAMFAVFVWPRPPHALITRLVIDHFKCIIGLPLICLLSFIVLWAFSVTQGHIEFEVGPLTFRGASGPAAFWILSVIVLTLMMDVSW